MNNNVFRKTMENIKNRMDIRLCTADIEVGSKDELQRTILMENLSAIYMAKTKLVFNK